MHNEKAPARLLAPLAVANFTIGAGAFAVIGLIAPLAARHDLTKAQAGWIMSAYALGYAFSSPLLIALTGALGRRTVLAIGMSVFALAALATAFAPSAFALYAARVLAAFGGGMVSPVIAAIAVAASPPQARGAALSFVFAGTTFAQVAGVPGAAFVGYTFGLTAAFVLAGALAALALAWVLVATPADVPFQPQSLQTLGRTLASPRHFIAVLLTVVIAAAGYLGITFTAPLAELRFGMGRDGVALMLAACGLGALAASLLSGWLTDRIGASRLLAIILVLQAILLPAFTVLSYGLALGLAIAFLWNLVGWGFTVPQQTRLMAIDSETQGVMLALNAAGIYLGSGLGAAIAGYVYEGYGLEATGVVGGALALFALGHLAFSDWLVRREESRVFIPDEI